MKINSFIYALSVLLATCCFTLQALAIDYNVNFTASGASNVLSSVVVQNLTRGNSVIVPVGHILNLTDQTTSSGSLTENDDVLKIYPATEKGEYFVSFYAANDGATLLNVYSLEGRKIIETKHFLNEGMNSFKVSLNKGLFIVKVSGNGFSYSGKIMNNIAQTNIEPKLELNSADRTTDKSILKKVGEISSVVKMTYLAGDLLLYKANSGEYSTIMTDIPNASKTVNFNFVACKDASGNNYPVVKIGSQLWMAENLKTTKFNDGADIPNVTEGYQWVALSTPGYCWANNNIQNKALFGALYNHYAVSTGNLAPVGWHVPTDLEWQILTTCLGGNTLAGAALKETGFLNWMSPNTGATNSSGFTALPGGYRSPSTGDFININSRAVLWSATELSGLSSRYIIENNSTNTDLSSYVKTFGFSVRCVKNSLAIVTTSEPSLIMATYAECGGNVLADGGENVTEYGMCWSLSESPTIADSIKIVGTGLANFKTTLNNLTPDTTYYVRAYAKNLHGVSYGEQISFKTLLVDPEIVTDADGNLYHTVKIGNQTWMVENLKTTKFNDGTDIPNVTDGYQWIGLSTPGYCWANNNIQNKAVYGALYNHYAVSTGKLAPAGWHVPTESDWMTLAIYLGGLNGSGSALKEVGTSHWNYPNSDATNSTGFLALPGGYRSTSYGNYVNMGSWGCFWSATVTNGKAWRAILTNVNGVFDYMPDGFGYGFSVRCIKD